MWALRCCFVLLALSVMWPTQLITILSWAVPASNDILLWLLVLQYFNRKPLQDIEPDTQTDAYINRPVSRQEMLSPIFSRVTIRDARPVLKGKCLDKIGKTPPAVSVQSYVIWMQNKNAPPPYRFLSLHNYKLQIANCCWLSIANCNLHITNYKLQIANTNYKLQIKN